MSKRVLVIDNDFFFVEFLSELLEKRGYEIIKAYDGKEGISKLEEWPDDFVFVDLMMPKIDGIQFIKIVRKRFPDADFRIIVVSGNVVEQLEDIRKAGADYCIPKGPMDIMSHHVNSSMDKIEVQPLPVPEGEAFLEPGKIYFLLNHFTHLFLLNVYMLARIDDREPKLFSHGVVLFLHAALKNPEAFIDIVRQVQVHTGLKIFELRSSFENSAEGRLQWKPEIKDDVRVARKTVELSKPLCFATAHCIPRKGGEYVSIAQNYIACLKHGKNLSFANGTTRG